MSVNNKTSDLDILPPKLIKESVELFLPFLHKLVGKIIEEQEYPKYLKRTITKPIYKGNGLYPNDLNKYRPISSMSFISKIVDR